MYRVEIQDDEGNRSLIPVTRPEISIGRKDGNVIRLTDRNVSRSHAMLITGPEGLTIEDLSSYTGTHLNGRKVAGKHRLTHGDVITIGDYQLRILGEGKAAAVSIEDSQITQIDAGVPKALEVSANAPLMEDDEDADPTAVITLRSGLGASPRESSHSGLIDGPPARLVVVSTNLAGTEIIIDRSPMRIGRGSECEARINHRSVSRHHASIEYRGDAFYVVDAGSANGITVNGERYAETPLRSGDRIDLGHVLVRFFPPGQIPEFADMLTAPPGRKGSPVVTLSLLALITLIVVVFFGHRYWRSLNSGVPTVAVADSAALQRQLQDAIDNRSWSEALRLLQDLDQAGFSLEMQEGYRKQISAEQLAEAAIDSANAAEARGEWDLALQHLEEIPADSVYRDEAKERMPDLEKKLVIQLLEQARGARDDGKFNDALRYLEVAESEDPGNREVKRLRGEINAEITRQGSSEPKAAPRKVAPQRNGAPKRARDRKTGTGTIKKRPISDRSTGKPKASFKDLLRQANGLLRQQSPAAAKRALVLLKRAQRIQNNAPPLHRSLGISYALLKEYDLAKKHYKRYLQLAPNSPDAPAIRRMLKGQ